MGKSSQAHSSYPHTPPVPAGEPQRTAGFHRCSKWWRETSGVKPDQHRAPLSHNSVTRNTQLRVAGDFRSTAVCVRSGWKVSGKLPCTRITTWGWVDSPLQLPKCSFSPGHSTPQGIKDLSPFSWETVISSLLILPLHRQTTPRGCLMRQPSGGRPVIALYAHLSWRLQFYFKLHC